VAATVEQQSYEHQSYILISQLTKQWIHCTHCGKLWCIKTKHTKVL